MASMGVVEVLKQVLMPFLSREMFTDSTRGVLRCWDSICVFVRCQDLDLHWPLGETKRSGSHRHVDTGLPA